MRVRSLDKPCQRTMMYSLMCMISMISIAWYMTSQQLFVMHTMYAQHI